MEIFINMHTLSGLPEASIHATKIFGLTVLALLIMHLFDKFVINKGEKFENKPWIFWPVLVFIFSICLFLALTLARIIVRAHSRDRDLARNHAIARFHVLNRSRARIIDITRALDRDLLRVRADIARVLDIDIDGIFLERLLLVASGHEIIIKFYNKIRDFD